ncbi:twin-arginine translocation signal domain-containing protein [Bermanella sp. R86510]|uniref:twin-arginine translocation signal domain-containing protein n=1 Tax=unclassified Bermanella TaxID=2627862 RepID=UPI0037CC12BB
MKRRTFLKHTATAAAAASFPSIVSAVNRKPTIRVVGTHVTLQDEIKRQAEIDLGINIEFYPGGSAEVLLKASTDPYSFDLYEQWSNSIKILWQANAIQPIDTQKIKYWNEINSLSKTGQINDRAQLGAGDAPNKLLYVQADGSLAAQKSDFVSYLPYVHNVDSFGYNSNMVHEGVPYETESWGWLLDPTYAGKVAIVKRDRATCFVHTGVVW